MLKQPPIAIQHYLRVSLLTAALLAALPAAAQTRLSLADLQAQITALQAQVTTLQSALAAVQGNSVLKLDGVLSYNPSLGTALFSGVDVQVINGAGLNTINGRGNLIVGYNSTRSGAEICSNGEFATQGDCEAHGDIWAQNHKSGSHNLVVGEWHAYSSQYGTLLGFGNASTAYGAVVTGGSANIARAAYSSVSGGYNNTVSGGYNNTVSGGYYNTASGTQSSSVSGGANNTASGDLSSISGGGNNSTSGDLSSVSGGYGNTAGGNSSSVSGGSYNTASGNFSSISGGNRRKAININQWVAGGLTQPQ